MAISNFVFPVPLTSIDSVGVSGTYAAINAGGLPNACFQIKIVNNSTKDVTVSWDGTNDHDYIPTLSTATFPFQSNAQPNAAQAQVRKGTTIYVKGTAGTGLVYLMGYYQVNT